MLDKILDTSKYVVETSKHVSIDCSNLIENYITITTSY